MAETTEQRAYHLIEELRADIDFELDDVLANIVRDLPEEYFQRLTRADQLTHLKALLAINICHLEQEIVLRSADGRHIAVVAGQDYPGLLASILNRLPTEQPLIGAKIFSSKTHEFIIDLFEFDSPETSTESDSIDTYTIQSAIEEVSRLTGQPNSDISEFVSLYPTNSRVVTSPDELADHFRAFTEVEQTNGIAVQTKNERDCNQYKTIVAASILKARDVFQRSAQYLASQSIDIEQAFLNDLQLGGQSNIAICSFLITAGAKEFSMAETSSGLTNLLKQSG